MDFDAGVICLYIILILAALIGGPITAGELTIGLIIYVIISILLDIL